MSLYHPYGRYDDRNQQAIRWMSASFKSISAELRESVRESPRERERKQTASEREGEREGESA